MKGDRQLLIVAFVVYITCAIFSTGYYHFDEHFQLIEFAELKSGHNAVSDLAWEYHSKIRSSLQPTLAYLTISSLRLFTIDDPYLIMVLIRAITATIALFAIRYFIKQTAFLVDKKFLLLYKFLSYFLCFIPFINNRFSSEAYSGLAIILSIAVFYSNQKYREFLIGFLLGLSFLFRFQTVFMSIGLLIWLVTIYKASFHFILKIVIAGAVVILCGVLLDTWFYGQIAFSFYNYFQENVIHDVASRWGVSPWYFYVTETFKLNPILATLIWLSLLCQLVFNSRSLTCFMIFPFLFVHFITPHKELRFLFPVCNLLPIIIICSIAKVMGFLQGRKEAFYFSRIIGVLLLVTNLIYLLILTFIPGDFQGRMNVTKYIHDSYQNQPVKLFVSSWNNPYKPIPVNQNFYSNKKVRTEPFSLDNMIFNNRDTLNLVAVSNDELVYRRQLLQSFAGKKIFSGIPYWIQSILDFLGYQNHSLVLYEIKKS